MNLLTTELCLMNFDLEVAIYKVLAEVDTNGMQSVAKKVKLSR